MLKAIYAGRRMPSFLIRERSVLGWSFRIEAAPEDPSIFQPVSWRTFRICSRSVAARSFNGLSFESLGREGISWSDHSKRAFRR